MQRLAANYSSKVGDPYERVRGRTEGAEGDGNPIGRTISTNPDSWELQETKPPTKEHKWVGLRPQAHMQQRTALSGLSGRECA